MGFWKCIELTNGQVTANYTRKQYLEYIPGSMIPIPASALPVCGGLDFDNDGNIWMSNYGASNPVSVRKDGQLGFVS